MSKGTRVLSVFLVLVLEFLAAWLIKPAQAFAGTAVIVVGPGADDLTIRTAEISKKQAEVLFWTTKKQDRQLWIELDADIFEGTGPGQYAKYRVQCQGRRCFSGDIKAGASVSGTNNTSSQGYKCWQVLLDQAGNVLDKADGWIIIKP
jgi:hypothetical protein